MLVVELSPRALRDLKHVAPHQARAILNDHAILKSPPWPGPPKVKRIQGTPYSRLRTGGFRSIFLQEGNIIVVLRIVDRKDLERILKGLR